MKFFGELKRRKVIRVGIAYVVGAWLLLQLTEVLSELLDLPQQIGPVVVAITAIGLPIALFLAWAYELTSEGLKRDSEVAPEQRSTGKTVNAIIISLLVLALGWFAFDKWGAGGRANPGTAPTTAAEIQAAPRSIAVLPFENFSGNPEDQYFADGLADTLLHKLAQITELKVIARNSSFQFKGSNKDVREIGEILGVETVLEGSVQRAGERVRIIAQLVRTSDGAHIWSQSFDDTTDNIFELQDRITASIVDQFQLSLSQAERDRLLRSGTDNPEAYDLVIRAMNQQLNLDEMTDTRAEEDKRVRLLTQAVELDPDYALAWAYLSRAWNGLAFATDSVQDFERFVAEAQSAADRSIALDPSLPDPHSALGWVAHRRGERMVASQHFRKALELDPNYLDAMSGLALQLGWSDPEEALRLLNRSHELDPTAALVHRQKHFALLRLGRMQEAIEELKKAIELEPTTGIFYNDLADLLERQGRPDEGAHFATKLLQQAPGSFTGQMTMAEAWLAVTDFERAGAWIRLMLRGRDDSDTSKLLEVERLLAAQQYDQALNQLEEVVENDDIQSVLIARRLVACLGLGQAECAVQQSIRFKNELDKAAAQGALPPEFSFWVALAQLLAREQANPGFDSSGPAQALLANPASNGSQFFGPMYYARAGVLSRAGDSDSALALLRQALPDGAPSVFNIDLFAMDVEVSLLLAPLRELPEFATWQQRYRERRAAMMKQMQDMEARGEIMAASTAERMIGS